MGGLGWKEDEGVRGRAEGRWIKRGKGKRKEANTRKG